MKNVIQVSRHPIITFWMMEYLFFKFWHTVNRILDNDTPCIFKASQKTQPLKNRYVKVHHTPY